MFVVSVTLKKNEENQSRPHMLSSIFSMQCIAAIACAEIPCGQWSDLIDALLQNIASGSSTEALREQTLETIGYICQDIVCMMFLC